MQCLAEFRLCHYLQMTPQEAHHATLRPRWKIVLNAMIQSRNTNCTLKPSNKTADTTEKLTGKPRRPSWKSTRDLANAPVCIGRSQRRRNWSGGCFGAAGSNTMTTRRSRRLGKLQPRSSLKIGQACSPSDTRRAYHPQHKLRSELEGLGSHARIGLCVFYMAQQSRLGKCSFQSYNRRGCSLFNGIIRHREP